MPTLIVYLLIGFILSMAFSDKENSLSPMYWIVLFPIMILIKIIERID